MSALKRLVGFVQSLGECPLWPEEKTLNKTYLNDELWSLAELGE
jgi:hypothetical protein